MTCCTKELKTNMTTQDKQQAIDVLRRQFTEQGKQVAAIELRLFDYYADLCAHPDHHNAYVLLGAVKFLRLLRTYSTISGTHGNRSQCNAIPTVPHRPHHFRHSRQVDKRKPRRADERGGEVSTLSVSNHS